MAEFPHTDIRRGIYHPDFPKELHDLRNFIALIWERLGLPEPTWIQDEAAHFLQRGPDETRSPFETPNDRIMVGGYRGMGKSYETATLACHCLALDPTLNILVISGSQEKSDEFTIFAKSLIEEIPELQHINPPRENRRRWSGPKFDVWGSGIQQAPSVRAASITGTIAGARADIIIPDDIETPINSETQAQRDRIDRLCDQFPFIYKENSRVIYLGTFQCEDSHYLKLPQKGYWMRLFPARFPGPPESNAYCTREAYGELLAPSISDKIAAEPELAGQPSDPLRFDEVELQKKEQELGGTSQAELQMGLNPTASDRLRYPLRLEDLIVMDCHRDLAPESVVYARGKETVRDLPNPGLRGDFLYKPLHVLGDWSRYEGKVTIVDPAGGGPDECAWGIWGWRNGFVYLLYLDAIIHRPEETDLEKIAQDSYEWGSNHIRCEDNYGGGAFQLALQPVVRRVYDTERGRGCSIDGVTHGQMKEKRIIGSCEVPMNQHRVIVSTSVVERDHQLHDPEYHLLHQLSRIRPMRGCLKRDDRADMFGQAMDYFNELEVFSVDHREQVDQADEAAEIRELEDFMRDGGLPVMERTFISHNRGVASQGPRTGARVS